jgi:hypothetical protein
MSFELNTYIVEFECDEGNLKEFVLAEDVSEAIHSIWNGWPEAMVQGVYKQVWWPEEE